MVGKQLDLLTWQRSAKVHVFPLSARKAKVEAVASNLSRKHGKVADIYWRQTITTLGNHLVRIGVAEAEIKVALRAFFDAVQIELMRQTYSDRHGGGAA